MQDIFLKIENNVIQCRENKKFDGRKTDKKLLKL